MTDRTADLLAMLATVEFPTLGHFLEEGFCDPGLRALVPGRRMLGVAHTVRLEVPDAVAVNRALVAMPEGAVLVIQVDGGRHAPIGEVTRAVAQRRGAAGIVVDGPVTDAATLAGSPLPVFARGFTSRTTKRLGTGGDGVGAPVWVGGVRVACGDLVLGDDNGVLVIRPDEFDAAVVERAAESDRAEPALLERIRSGEDLSELLAL